VEHSTTGQRGGTGSAFIWCKSYCAH